VVNWAIQQAYEGVLLEVAWVGGLAIALMARKVERVMRENIASEGVASWWAWVGRVLVNSQCSPDLQQHCNYNCWCYYVMTEHNY